jgi:hypothetical protein
MNKYKGNNIPKWLNLSKVVDAAKNTIKKANIIANTKLQKTASEKLITVSYRDSNGHIIYADDPNIVAQISKGKKPVDKFGNELIPHRQIKVTYKPENSNIQSEFNVKKVGIRERQIHPSYLVDSTINRHLQYKALQFLTDYASDNGLHGARARYLFGKNASSAGKQFQGYREITAEISFPVGPNVRKSVVATVGIDVGGKFIPPKTFKDSTGTEYPFTIESVSNLLKGMEFTKPSREVKKRSDIPKVKKPDPTRFQAVPK